MTKKVLVLAEIRDGNLRNVSLEALAAARRVANDGEVLQLYLAVMHQAQSSIGTSWSRLCLCCRSSESR